MSAHGNLSPEYFVWSEPDMTLDYFLKRYGTHAPFLIMFTSGYMGRDEWVNEISAGEVRKIHIVAVL